MKELLPGWRGRFVNSEHMTFGVYRVTADAVIPAHAHPNEEVWYVIAGELEMTIAEETAIASIDQMAVIPPNTLHQVRALSTSWALVVDHPRRQSIRGVELMSANSFNQGAPNEQD